MQKYKHVIKLTNPKGKFNLSLTNNKASRIKKLKQDLRNQNETGIVKFERFEPFLGFDPDTEIVWETFKLES